MSEKIEPALTAKEWLEAQHPLVINSSQIAMLADAMHNDSITQQIIALANYELANDNPRKITREWINELRYAAGCLRPIAYLEATPNPTENDVEMKQTSDCLSAIADALESYLPPE